MGTRGYGGFDPDAVRLASAEAASARMQAPKNSQLRDLWDDAGPNEHATGEAALGDLSARLRKDRA